MEWRLLKTMSSSFPKFLHCLLIFSHFILHFISLDILYLLIKVCLSGQIKSSKDQFHISLIFVLLFSLYFIDSSLHLKNSWYLFPFLNPHSLLSGVDFIVYYYIASITAVLIRLLLHWTYTMTKASLVKWHLIWAGLQAQSTVIKVRAGQRPDRYEQRAQHLRPKETRNREITLKQRGGEFPSTDQ